MAAQKMEWLYRALATGNHEAARYFCSERSIDEFKARDAELGVITAFKLREVFTTPVGIPVVVKFEVTRQRSTYIEKCEDLTLRQLECVGN